MPLGDWSSAFEATPAGSDSRADGDDRIRELKDFIREREEVDHIFGPGVESAADTGEHRWVTLKDQAAQSGVTAGFARLYSKDNGGIQQLYWVEDDDTEREVVDLSLTQTLLNKTLTSPSIGGGSFTGVSSFADGSAAAPSITNIGDVDTGIFFPAANAIGFAGLGVEALRITVPTDLTDAVVAVLSTEESTSPTTGALTVGDGLGVAGACWIGGLANIAGALTLQAGGAFAGTITGTPTFNGAVIFSGSPVLTTPDINGGTVDDVAMGGTITGNPTFSGAPILSTPDINGGTIDDVTLGGTLAGTPTFSGNLIFSGTLACNDAVTIATTKNLLLNAATAPTSLAGGVAMLNGTAASAALANGISMWAEDDAGASESHLVVRNEGLAKAHLLSGMSGDEDVNIGGMVNVNTTTETQAGVNGVLMTYTMPAGLLGADGKGIRITAWGRKTGAGSISTVQFRYGDTPTVRTSFRMDGATTQSWRLDILVIRVSNTVAEIIVSGGSGTEGDLTADRILYDAIDLITASSGVTHSSAQTVDFNVSFINGADTVTQDGMVIEVF